MATQLLASLVLIPVLGLLGVLVLPKRWERAVYRLVMATMASEFVALLALGAQWLGADMAAASLHAGTLHVTQGYSFSLDFFVDTLSAVFVGMAVVTTSLIASFSRYYMHREQGFKRFYATVLLFFLGLSLVTLAGNFDVLLPGWEFIGISSVLLIAFYRDRYLPVRNALKVFSMYRIADAFLLVAAWYAHHTFEGGVHFSELPALVAAHGNQFGVLGFLLCIVALVKSAQFPFSYWLPRAMEGPTTSSAIFYGALSVHIGLFLLIRTYPLWEGSWWLRIVIAASGCLTAIVATSIARVQSSSKTQIAYASVTQIGIMFVEIAAGLPWLALLHFISNASLRTYQLLISPSIAGYLVHDQFFHAAPPARHIKQTLMGRLQATAYVLGIKEWGMNSAVTRFVWLPLKSAGRAVAFLDRLPAQAASLALFVLAAGVAATVPLSARGTLALSTALAVVSLIFYIRAHATKHAARTCWNLLMLGNLFGVLFLVTASAGDWQYVGIYALGVVLAFLAGHAYLRYLEARNGSLALREYHGLISGSETPGHLFFVVALVFMAFPVSPSFLAQDALVRLIPEARGAQLLLFCCSYVLAGAGIMRLYTKVFFGPHKKNPHEIGYRSS